MSKIENLDELTLNFEEENIKILSEVNVPYNIENENHKVELWNTKTKSTISFVMLALTMAIALFGFLCFPDDSKKYAFCTSIINLIIGSVIGYMYSESNKKT